MSNVVLTVKRVLVGVGFYTLQFNEKFDGLVETANKQFIESQIDSIGFDASYMHQSVINLLPGVDLLYAAKLKEGKSFAPCVAALLKEATITVKRDKFAADEVYVTADGEEKIHPYNGYTKDIIDIEVSTKVQKQLDKILDDALSI